MNKEHEERLTQIAMAMISDHRKVAQADHLLQPKYGDKRLDPNRELTGRFRDYLTEIDVTSPCERLPEDYQRDLDREA